MTMQLIRSFRESLALEPLVGLGIMYPAPGIIERIGPDWDWIWIDCQHGGFGHRDMLNAVRACNLIKRPAVVRVPGNDPGFIGKALDTAAEGVMVPMIETPEQARKAVEAARFAPLGKRSYGGRRPIDLDGRGYAGQGAPEPVLVLQIENSGGLENCEKIAAVEGVDVLFFGPDDMALEQGLPMDRPRPKGHYDDTIRRIAEAAKSRGIAAGGVFTTPDDVRQAVDLGFRLIVSSADVVLLLTGSREKAEETRRWMAGNDTD